MIDRYLQLIEGTLRAALSASIEVAEAPGTVSMRRGLGFVRSVVERSRDVGVESFSDDRKVVDGAGHSRSMYRGLLRYAIAGINGVRADATPLVKRIVLPASDARDIVGELWDALSTGEAVHAAKHVASLQQPSGEWFKRTDSDNPEPLWYHELVTLHAMATIQRRLPEAGVADAVARSATYVAAEVQPDHASSQPWAIHALLTVPDGVYLADMMLHAAGVQQPSTMDAVSLILLADALDCLRAYDPGK